ncbi:hypothetical protein [Streptomyces sp. NPDC002082]|uniref:hypothetical protein n=1 Tax=Streptomyces sp. NPDC002082 TaxID=3154772 RepID=UPI00331CDB62
MITLQSVSVCPACVAEHRFLGRWDDDELEAAAQERASAHYADDALFDCVRAILKIVQATAIISALPSDNSVADILATTYRLISSLLLAMAALGPWQLTRSERLLLQNALVARNAAIDGDHVTVDEFSRTWLGLEHPARWRAAVEMALLGDWVDALHDRAVDDPALRHLLRREADEAHHQMLPLWEHRTRGQRVTLLSRPVGDGLTLADVVTDRRCPESLLLDDEFQDPRVGAVLRQLAEPEEKVARTWAAGADSWAVAAVDSAQPAAYGERVRRKLHRLGARQTERAAAAVTR